MAEDTNNPAGVPIGPGCFVKVVDGNTCYWAEVEGCNTVQATGQVRRELGGKDCPNAPKTEKATFERGKIVALGCDKYCWC